MIQLINKEGELNVTKPVVPLQIVHPTVMILIKVKYIGGTKSVVILGYVTTTEFTLNWIPAE